MVRGRLLPRGTPALGGYDLAGTTVTEDEGDASAAWDWFLLSDGRLALTVLKADQQSLSAAHRLLTARGLLRDFADDPLPSLGALLTRVNRGLRAGWVEGISGSVSCGIVALSQDGVEWASAGAAAGTIVRADGSHEDLIPDDPALGSDEELEYRSMRLRLQPGDHLVAFSEGPSDSVIVGRKFLASKGRYAGPRERLDALVRRVQESAAASGGVFEVTAVFVGRTESAPYSGPRSGSDAVARAAQVFDAATEDEPAEDR
jgi:serine phosphatase RsbU (regulator of sigma subunit)